MSEWLAGRKGRRALCAAASLTMVACGDNASTDTTPERAIVRTCETAAHGTNPAFEHLDSTRPAAAIAFVNPPIPEHIDPSYYEPLGNGRYRPIKVLVGVAAGSTVTVTVPESARRHVALLYDSPRVESTDGRYSLSDGEVEVTFEGCDDPDTGFPGSFLVAGPRCVELELRLGDDVERIMLAFGVSTCARAA